MAIAAERNVKVVAQPGRERNVPPAPEIGEPNRRIRKPKVVRQRKPQAKRSSDRSNGVARKVAEDLATERQRPHPRIHKARDDSATVNLVYHRPRKPSASTAFSKSPSVISARPKRI